MTTMLRRLRDDDRGTTMIELVVGMLVMTVFMGMFTGAMLLMGNTVNKVEAVSDTSTQLADAFLTLDREVRYATGVSTPAYSTALPGWNVEFSSMQYNRSTSPATQINLCTQLAIFSGKLWQRTWTVGSNNTAVSGSGTDWRPLASSIDPTSTTQSATTPPFVLSVAAGSGLQQLAINLTSKSTLAGSATSLSSTTYTALNAKSAGGPIDPSTVCQQVAPEAAKP